MSIYEDIRQGLEEALAYEKGQITLRTNTISIIEPEVFSAHDIKNIRKATVMSQAAFAAAMGVTKKTVEAWESGKNHPGGTAKRLLAFVEDDPKFFEKEGIVYLEQPRESKIESRCFSASSTKTTDFSLPCFSRSPIVVMEVN